jgi:transcriptional regulator GlxA family with amidase domain
MALKIAKRMVVFLKRPGDQSQFSNLLASQSKAKRFTDLIDWIEKNLDTTLIVTDLANKCAMSPRNFSRRRRVITNTIHQFKTIVMGTTVT